VRTAAAVVLILLAGIFEMWIELVAQNHPWGVGIVGGVLLAVLALVVFLYPSGWLKLGLAILAGGWAFALVAGLDSREKELSYYCRYGAQSQAQLDGCMASVNTHDIQELDTPAARFAYGETTDCGRGSGPFCPAAAKDVAAEYGGEG
jgi:hypothetical protein